MEEYKKLEVEWAVRNGLDPCGMVCVNSGTAALHLALEALQLLQGSECICSDFNMIAIPRAITLAGLTPVLVDCGDDLLIDIPLLPNDTAALAIVVTHVYGRRCNMAQVNAKATDVGMMIVEDIAEAHGVRPHGCTDAATWSYYKNKIIHGEEGGAVWFRSHEHADRARQLRSLGFTAAHDFNHIPRGHNYRMSNAHAKLVLDSLAMAWMTVKQRRHIETWYEKYCPAKWKMPSRDAPWVYDLRLPGIGWPLQDKVVKVLNACGIAARHGFKPMHVQEEFKDCKFVHGDDGHRSSLLSAWTVYLPIQPNVTTEDDCRRSFEVIREVLGESP